ncbi:MAG: radical SAM protein [Phycisphaerae bacterium]|nr:radical SAM protein [Phycisphaerae bacterium]
MIRFDGSGAWRRGLSQFATNAAVKGADLALQIPRVRDFFLDKLITRLSVSYEQRESDREQLANQRWFAEHLRPFLHRLLDERPAAARAILRFLGTWIQDVHRRSDARVDGAVTPCTVVIEPTDRCNFNCPGCYARSTADGCDLSFEQLGDIVEQVIDMGVTLVTLSGGEPFLRERADRTLTRLARRFDRQGFLVYTNGSLIDEAIADRLAEVGNVFPAISVEGFEHQTDARRGAGVAHATRQVRRRLADRGVMCGFSATVTRENCEAICSDDFIDMRIDEGDMFGWFFLMMPIGRAPRADLMVTPDQRAMLRETIRRWRREDRPIFLGDFWNDGPLVGGCIAGGRYYFHIYANGDISPCVFAPVACGNILDIVRGDSDYASLDDFVRRNPVFRGFRDEQRKITDRNRPCLLVDHPNAFRRVARFDCCRRAKNFPDGYVDGEIGRTIDRAAAAWKQKAAALPPLVGPAGAGRYDPQALRRETVASP